MFWASLETTELCSDGRASQVAAAGATPEAPGDVALTVCRRPHLAAGTRVVAGRQTSRPKTKRIHPQYTNAGMKKIANRRMIPTRIPSQPHQRGKSAVRKATADVAHTTSERTHDRRPNPQFVTEVVEEPERVGGPGRWSRPTPTAPARG